MRIEDVIAYRIARGREETLMSQAQLGRALERYLIKPWSRQSVSAAEKGRRAFTAAELVALAMVLECTVEALLEPPPGVETVELGDESAEITPDGIFPVRPAGVDARFLRAAAATNEHLADLTDAVRRQRDQMDHVRGQVQVQWELQNAVQHEIWRAVKGGADASADQPPDQESEQRP